MKSTGKILVAVSAYALIFIPPVIAGEDDDALFRAVFAAAFSLVFLGVIFSGFFIFKQLLAALGVRVLSGSGDIVKTDFGRSIDFLPLRILVNLAADTLFNLVLMLCLIVFAISSALVAQDLTRAALDI